MSAEHAAAWERLLASALLGTERQPRESPAIGGALGATLSALSRDDREGALLGAAGVLSLYRQAGRIPSTFPGPTPVAASPDDATLPRASSRASRHLRQMLEGTYSQLLPEWFATAAKVGRRVPEELLPAVLDHGRDHREFREMLFPVVGRRGAWLAARNPEWAWALSGAAENQDSAKELFHTGTVDARAGVLKRLRAQDPQAARELLQTTWGDDAADEREEFLATFAVGLGMADEPFLETALDDKSKKVRAQAADLLAHLPESRLVQRMTARLAGMLSFAAGKKGVLARLAGAKNKLEVKLPDDCDKALQRDGVELKPPQGAKKKGEKAWWLQQMIASVPPAHWTASWATTPEVIQAAIAETDWHRDLIDGLIQAALRFRDATWAEALLDTSAPVELLMLLPPARQDAWLREKLEKSNNPLGDDSPLLPFLGQYAQTWSPELTRSLLEKTRRIAGSKAGATGYYHLRHALKTFATHLPPELNAEANAGWPKESAEWETWLKPVDEFLALLQFRHDVREALKE